MDITVTKSILKYETKTASGHKTQLDVDLSQIFTMLYYAYDFLLF